MRKPNKKEINLALNSFSKKERLVFFALVIIFILSTLAVFNILNKKYMVEVPALGGTLTEGVIGEAPRFINPLLATSDADRDLVQLIYSGLLRVGPDGSYIGDLAESYNISPDGLTYTFKIRENAVWQDGKPVTSDDVEFTIQKARDPGIKSYKRPSFEGVSVEKPDDKTVVLKLKQPYSPFLENATTGILPKHIWSGVDAENFTYSKFNISPVGSGPYKIESISNSVPPQYYDLTSFEYFTLGEPKIENLRIRFYQGEETLLAAYRSGEVESINTIPPQTAKAMEEQGINITRVTLPRIFAVFFNQNHSKVLADKYARYALEAMIDKEHVVKDVLLGYGQTIDGPISTLQSSPSNASTTDDARTNTAKKFLTKGGWKFNQKTGTWEKTVKKVVTTLRLDLATADTPELKNAATLIKEDWEKLGVKVTLKVFEIGDLNQNVIRPRKYDALFFGEIVGRNPDLFSFWHSSQRNDPGLNIAMYTNSKVDKILENARVQQDPNKKQKNYSDLQKEIANDTPAVFIYSPDFLYSTPTKIKDLVISNITIPSDRFINIYKWYIDTDKIWKIFTK
ncbi:MAG: ABC transporter substrate-binding protein [bacterium]|nr:ABC transporter substrate-binding protein [bacterium]